MELGLQLEECEVLIEVENVRKAARGMQHQQIQEGLVSGSQSQRKRKYKNAIEFTDTEATYNPKPFCEVEQRTQILEHLTWTQLTFVSSHPSVYDEQRYLHVNYVSFTYYLNNPQK